MQRILTRRVAIRSTWTFVIFALLALLVLGPLVAMLWQSFAPDRGSSSGMSLDHYRALGSRSVRSALRNTLVSSVGGTVGAVAIGTVLAWLAARTDVAGRAMVQIAGMVPMFFSALVGTLAWSALGSPRTGYLNAVLAELGIGFRINVYTMGGIVFVLAIFYAPFAFIFVFTALTMTNEDLEGAARVHGASEWKVTTRVTLPLVLPSIAGASILIFVLVSENFPVVEILGSFARMDFLPSLIYRLVNEFPPRLGQAAAMGVVALVVLWTLVWFQNFYIGRRSYTTIGGKGGTARPLSLGRWRWAGFAFAFFYLLVAAILPTIALVIGAFRKTPFYTGITDLLAPSNFTTKHFTESLSYAPFQTGLRNSLILGLGGALVGVVVNFLTAYSARRHRMYGARAVEYLALAPVAVPALILGLAYVTFWLRLPISLHGTMTIMVLAYVARFIPQGFESFAGTLVKIDEELEDSAVTAGASRVRALTTITVPLLRSAFVSTGVLLFVLSFRELTAALFLYAPRTRVLSVVIYGQWVQGGSWARLASMSLVFTAVLLVAAVVSRRGLDSRR